MRLFSQALFLLSVTTGHMMAQCTPLWTGYNGDWNDTNNWSTGCIPNGVNDSATFTFIPFGGYAVSLDLGSITLDTLKEFNPSDVTMTGLPTDLKLNNLDFQGDTLNLDSVSLMSQTPTGPLNISMSPLVSSKINNATLICGSLNLTGSNMYSQLRIEGNSSSCTDANISGGTLQVNSGATFTVSEDTNISGGLVQVFIGGIYNTVDATIDGGDLSVVGQFNASGSIVHSKGLTTNRGTIQGEYLLGGSGVVGGNGIFSGAFHNGGEVIPEVRLTFDQYVQTLSGQLSINIFTDAKYGSIFAESAELNGTLKLAGGAGYKVTPGLQFTIVETDSDGVSGTFNQVINRVAPYIDPIVFYNSDSVVVEFYPNFPGIISAKDAVFSTQNQINFLLLRQMDRMVSRGCCCSCGWDAFLGPIGAVGCVDRRGDFAAHNFYTAGAIVGADYAAPFGGFGVSFDYEHLFLDGRVVGQADVDRLHGNLYGAFHVIDGLVFNMIGGLAYDWNDFRRNMKPGLEGISRSKPMAREVNGLVGFEYALCVSDFRIIPFVDYEYTYYHIQHARESAPDLFYALEFEKHDFESSRTVLGVRANGCFHLMGMRLIPEVNAAWEYEFGTRSKRLVPKQLPDVERATLLPITAHFEDRHIAMVGFDIEAEITRCLSIDFSYEFEGNNHYMNNFFYLGLNTQF